MTSALEAGVEGLVVLDIDLAKVEVRLSVAGALSVAVVSVESVPQHVRLGL